MIVFLGREDSAIFAYLKDVERSVIRCDAPLGREDARAANFVVSHGYRHILRPQVLAAFACPAINVHISYLPWNRGADPNLWSHIDATPKGVSIHVIDAGIDTGPLLVQRQVHFPADATLASSYAELQTAAAALMAENWPLLRAKLIQAQPQVGTGSTHKRREREALAALLTRGWDTPVAALADAAGALSLSAQFFTMRSAKRVGGAA